VGIYTDITEIVAPSSARAGDSVDITARVRNLADYSIYISTSGKFDNTIFYLYPESSSVGAGATYSFSGSFTMPNRKVRVYVWSWFWTGSEWYQDDAAYVDISLEEVVEEFRGTLSRKELEYDESRVEIPVY